MKINKRTKLLVGLFISLSITGFGQINTEKFRKYSEKEGFLFNAGFRFGYSGGNSQYVSTDATFRLDYNRNKNNAFIVANYDYKETESSKIANKGFVHLRGIHALNNKLATEVFLQQEFNEFLLLEDRKLVGASLRIRIMDFRSQDSLSGFRSNIGLGLMYEHEVYDIVSNEVTKLTKDLVRFSSYLTLDWNITNRINCWVVGYFQPDINNISDFKSVIETGIEIGIIGKLYFTIDLSYRYNSKPVGDVKNYDTALKNGLRFSFP
jgi:hypothetical protein